MSLVNSIILFLVALLLGGILIPLGFALTIIILLICDFKACANKLTGYFKFLAICIDQMGNVALEFGLNAVLITKNGYQFGNKMETISSALGKNQVVGTLTKLGWVLVNILDWINPNHCIKAINNKV